MLDLIKSALPIIDTQLILLFRTTLNNSKNAHMKQIEQMESEELLAQKKLRTEVIQLEDMLGQVSG